jgi:hypothetical protein
LIIASDNPDSKLLVHAKIPFLDNSRPAGAAWVLFLTHGTVLLGKLIIASINFSPFVEPEGSLPCPQECAIGLRMNPVHTLKPCFFNVDPF